MNNIKKIYDAGYDMKICQKNSAILMNSPKILVKYWKTRFYVSGPDGLNRLPLWARISYRGGVSYQLDPQNPLDTPYCIASNTSSPPVIVVDTMNYIVADELSIFDVGNKLNITHDDALILARANNLKTGKTLHKWQVLVVPILFDGVYYY